MRIVIIIMVVISVKKYAVVEEEDMKIKQTFMILKLRKGEETLSHVVITQVVKYSLYLA